MDVDVSDPAAFGDLLLELRVGRGLSQEELAADAKVSVRTISDLERGVTRRPHRDTIRALAGALGLPGADRAAFERLARQSPPARPPRRPVDQRVDVPAPATSLLGRDADLDALTRLIRDPAVRLVTVTGYAVAHNNLGGLAAELGDYPTARVHLLRAATGFRARGEDHALSFCLAMLSQTYLGGGEVEQARHAAEEALRVARAVEYGHGLGLALARLGDLARHDGDAPAGSWGSGPGSGAGFGCLPGP